MREICMLRVMWRGLGTELRYGLRHRCLAKAAGNCYSPDLRPPHQDPTLPKRWLSPTGPANWPCGTKPNHERKRASTESGDRLDVFRVRSFTTACRQWGTIRLAEIYAVCR